jgi:hypothetical protein
MRKTFCASLNFALRGDIFRLSKAMRHTSVLLPRLFRNRSRQWHGTHRVVARAAEVRGGKGIRLPAA